MKGTKAIKRALKTKDAHRLGGGSDGKPTVPLITGSVELITPESAEKMLNRNGNNRPINWNRVEAFAKLMEIGEWRFHGQGIILDDKNNILTGQKRLWAIIYSGTSQHMHVSRGTSPDMARFIDRGTEQSARDLASRSTERKHSPTEQSFARALCALRGITKPSVDQIADTMTEKSDIFGQAMKKTRGVKKTKQVNMMIAAICSIDDPELFGIVSYLSDILIKNLAPIEINKCWNRGAAFTLAMEKAVAVAQNGHLEQVKND